MIYLTNQQFVKDITKLFQVLNEKYPDLAGIAGVPRSGMVVASFISVMSGLPLYEATLNGISRLSNGRRIFGKTFEGTIVVIEDSVFTGNSLAKIRRKLGPNYKYAVVYCSEEMIQTVDAFAVQVPMCHFFEWHMFGSALLTDFQNQHGKGIMLDFDGVLCEDCPPAYDDDGKNYINFLENAIPLHLPRTYPVPYIVTARLEKYRPQTQAWLDRYGVTCQNLIMGPWADIKERAANYNAGQYKGQHFINSGCALFVESCPIQSRQIRDATGRPVICKSTGEYLNA